MEITEARVALREGALRVPSPAFARAARPGSDLERAGRAVGSGEGRSGEKRLKAYATVTFDRCFVVRNIKIIDGRNGLFIAMPSRKPKVACGRCAFKNDLGGRFCSQCGGTLLPGVSDRLTGAGEGESAEAQGYRDIAHPITAEFRQYLQDTILKVYAAECAKAQAPSGSGVSHPDDEAV